MPPLEQQNPPLAGPTDEAPRASQQADTEIPKLEWIIGGIGLVVVAGVIGFLLYQALSGNQTPPEIRVSIQSIQETQSGYRVGLVAVNQGGTTAEGVVIEGELTSGGKQLERSYTTIEFMPPSSEIRAGLFFGRDPRQFELQVRPLGYEDP